MTGFGRECRIIDGREITAEIRSVNHKYHEFTARTPRRYSHFEERLKGLVGRKISRGKVEVNIIIHEISGKEVEVILNRDVVESYLNAIGGFFDTYSSQCRHEFSVSDVLRIPDAFTVVKKEIDEDEIWAAISEVATAALDKFVSMREVEGERLRNDILERLNSIEGGISMVEELSPKAVEKYRAKLLEKMREVIDGIVVDEQRILLEAAIFAEKTAVDEETVRLRSHLEQVRLLFEREDVVGRKLDFIVQEMNREVNTIGSKANEIAITRTVVDLKSELGKIREQIQNIE
jgi:uncharacterized protein (TIGR00255 family)